MKLVLDGTKLVLDEKNWLDCKTGEFSIAVPSSFAVHESSDSFVYFECAVERMISKLMSDRFIKWGIEPDENWWKPGISSRGEFEHEEAGVPVAERKLWVREEQVPLSGACVLEQGALHKVNEDNYCSTYIGKLRPLKLTSS